VVVLDVRKEVTVEVVGMTEVNREVTVTVGEKVVVVTYETFIAVVVTVG
jgi:Asp/Glu/hydantoin racemase